MKSELLLDMIEATNEVLDDMEVLNKLYDKEYFDLEEYVKIKKSMIQRMCDIKEYYEGR